MPLCWEIDVAGGTAVSAGDRAVGYILWLCFDIDAMFWRHDQTRSTLPRRRAAGTGPAGEDFQMFLEERALSALRWCRTKGVRIRFRGHKGDLSEQESYVAT